MQPPEPPYDLLGLAGAVLISLISGFVSIAQRIVRGHQASLLWVTSEFLAAILCGYLMYDGYSVIADSLPAWLTQPVMVALAAHMGGRSLQGLENTLTQRYNLLVPSSGSTDKKPPDKK